MSEEATTEENQEEGGENLAGGAYEVIRNRLTNLNQQLLEKLEQLNARRKEVFGGQESKIIGNERIQTENNCVARDLCIVGSKVIFGYNVFVGLKSEITLNDVFSVQEFADNTFTEIEPALLHDENFLRHFSDLYKYYKNAKFVQFFKTHSHLLMVFQIGETVADSKIFRWAIEGDNLVYIDDRGDAEYELPPQHDFEWTEASRDNQVTGRHPHISIKDRVFVETVGGDLTIKVENNTESGEGVYAEKVDNPDQTLDDASFYYAEVGNLILLKILPYQENRFRYFVFNEKMQTAERIDSIDQACIELPEDHGIIFPKGYYLQNGVTRQFQEDVDGMQFLETHRSPNGEDFLYIFYHPIQGRYILLQYNLITKEIANPIFCHGYNLFENGQMVLFSNPDDEPKRVHAMQIWQTSFYSDTHEVVQQSGTYLNSVGNRDLVKGVSDCYHISRLIMSEQVSMYIYQDILSESVRTMDSYHWMDHEETFKLKPVVDDIRKAAVAAIDEYDKVVRIKEHTASEIAKNEKAANQAIADASYGSKRGIDDFVNVLNELRSRRGQVISLKDLKYADIAKIDGIEAALSEATESLSRSCVEFLLDPKALKPYLDNLKELDTRLEAVEKVADLEAIDKDLEDSAQRLDLLTDIVNNLQIDDSTQTTQIVDAITEVYGQVNRVKAISRNLRKDIGKGEASAEFAAQFKLVTQSITNYIGLCDSVEKCDEFLTKIMITVEELEGRFADYDEYIEQLAEKREEAYNAFSNRKEVLEEEVKRRVGGLLSSAERILKGIENRADNFESIDEVNSYFASDLMVAKCREIIQKLYDAEQSVQADDLNGRLKTLRDEIIRKLRDKLELFSGGENVISFGDYQFNVNTQPLNLTTVIRDGDMFFHLTGTDYYELIEDPSFLETRDVWGQELISENQDVYRGEYLAYKILMAGTRNDDGLSLRRLTEEAESEDQEKLLDTVRTFASSLYSEGYDKGIHDQDATHILRALVGLYNESDLLRYDSSSRAFAIIFWSYFDNAQRKKFLRSKMRSFGTIGKVFEVEEINRVYIDELHAHMRDFYADLVPDADPSVIMNAAEFLFYELQDQEELLFTINTLANDLYERFIKVLDEKDVREAFANDVEALEGDLKGRLDLVRDWVNTLLSTSRR